jgi:hypothetical protein
MMIAETVERTGAFGAGTTPRTARSSTRVIARQGMLRRMTSRLISAAGFFRLHWARSDMPPTKRTPSNVSTIAPNLSPTSLSKTISRAAERVAHKTDRPARGMRAEKWTEKCLLGGLYGYAIEAPEAF